ncbi:hypothetical protein JOM56_014461 [Amanita muscaria]
MTAAPNLEVQVQPRRCKRQRAAAERARAAKCNPAGDKINSDLGSEPHDSDTESDCEVTKWLGGVIYISSGEESEAESENDSGGEWIEDELEGTELMESLKKQVEKRIDSEPEELELTCHTPYATISRSISEQDWKKAESNRSLGYNRHSERTRQRQNQKARIKEEKDCETQRTKGAELMRNYFKPAAAKPKETTAATKGSPGNKKYTRTLSVQVFTGYISDMSDDEDIGPAATAATAGDDIDGDDELEDRSAQWGNSKAPPLKRRKLDVSVLTARRLACEQRREEMERGLVDVDKLIKSKQDVFRAGSAGLQSYRARTIQSCLHMVLKNQRKLMDASERAAEGQGFAPKWGGRLVRSWVHRWIRNRELPTSMKGNHAKSFSFLDDPAIRAELRSFVRSNKWSMDPKKLAEFSKDNIVTSAAKEYLQGVIRDEIPRALKQYMDVELFPRIHLKVGKGVLIRTARRSRRWLHIEGFRYTEHKKALYFDGHERPDVLEYRQTVFLPKMEEHRGRLVEFVVGNTDMELIKPTNYVERRLVLVAHDEMTAQANDGKGKSWVLDGEHPLKKKGVGRGLHQSDVICSTVGWLKEASQTLEYGKNYDGYWNGELFVKQLKEKIIPAFESAHDLNQTQGSGLESAS